MCKTEKNNDKYETIGMERQANQQFEQKSRKRKVRQKRLFYLPKDTLTIRAKRKLGVSNDSVIVEVAKALFVLGAFVFGPSGTTYVPLV